MFRFSHVLLLGKRYLSGIGCTNNAPAPSRKCAPKWFMDIIKTEEVRSALNLRLVMECDDKKENERLCHP